MRKQSMLLKGLGALLLLLTLACNFPGFPEGWHPLRSTEATATQEIPGTETTPQPGESPEATPEPLETPGSPLLPSPTPSPTATETPTPTPTPTETPETVSPGPPLAFLDPAWELVTWQQVPNANDWEGTLRIRVTGGTPPYRAQLENQTIVSGLDVPARWRLCAAMPATVRVWSADGQFKQTTIWVPEVGCAD